MQWVRPESVPMGQVWLRFKGREVEGRPATMYQIRDVEDKERKRCLDFMQKHFLKDEPLCKVLEIPSDPASVSTIRSNWEGFVSQRVCLACYTETDGRPDQVVACNNLIVRTRQDEDEVDYEQIKGDSWKRLRYILEKAGSLVDIFDHYKVDVYLDASGLTVDPDHRGQKIGARMIEARKPLCKALGITAVATVFTAKASQVLADKCGYEILGTLPYSDLVSSGILTTEEAERLDTNRVELRGTVFNHD